MLNKNFLTSAFFIACFSLVNWVHLNKNYTIPVKDKDSHKLVYYGIPVLLLMSIFLAFQAEIVAYWDYRYIASQLEVTKGYLQHDSDLPHMKSIWMINFSMIFFTALSLINHFKISSKQLGNVSILLSVFTLLVFLLQGLYAISELRESYASQELAQFYQRGTFNILARYISLAFAGGLLYTIFLNSRDKFHVPEVKIGFDIVLHVSIVWILTSEMIHWMEIAGFEETYKLGLSIFWGIYSLILIILGISKKAKHLRIGAMTFFGITLIKLFVYDIAHLNTISKTIVFVSLGILLLIISFLYNKFKDSIFDEQSA